MSKEVLPIYNSSEHDLKKYDHSNKGLLFERFFDQYDSSYKVIDGGNSGSSGKTLFLKKFNGPCGNDKAIYNLCHNQIKLVNAIGGDSKCYKLMDHFVTGMGNSHPVENGFLWHHSLGTPYLSGSMVKGLVRALIEEFFDSEHLDDKRNLLLKWFGSKDKNPQKDSDSVTGELIFFDAIPTKTPYLVTDIMTPHMGDWYAKGDEIKQANDYDKIPADWHDPTPIPFLVVKSATFLFSIATRPNSDIDLAEVFDCLDKALQYLGAGAKTQTGYGYMEFDKRSHDDLFEDIKKKEAEQKKERERQKATANSTPFHQELINKYDLLSLMEKTDQFKTSFDQCRDEIIAKLQEHKDERGAIEMVVKIAKIHYKDKMAKPAKITKENQRKWVEALLELEKGIS